MNRKQLLQNLILLLEGFLLGVILEERLSILRLVYILFTDPSDSWRHF
jgi:hypothetical protein